MSVGYTTTKDSLSKIGDLQQSYPTYGQPSSIDYWKRPSEWLTLPSVSASSERIVGLVTISDSDGQFLALTCQVTGGTYTVDWGDGTVETITSNTQANHQYTYSSISSTLTSEGWKQVIVQVYPTSSSDKFSVINLGVKYSSSSIVGTLNTYCNPWVDIILSSTVCTNITLGTQSSQSYLTRVQQVQILSTGGPTMSSLGFGGMTQLQSIPVLNLSAITSGVSMQAWFYGCTKLKVAPKIDWSKCTNAFQMFYNCYSLIYVPDATTGMHPTYWSSPGSVVRLMFQNCTSLIRAPWLDTSKNVSTQNMFNGCYNLQYVPDYDYSICTDLSNMFTSCASLQYAPKFNNLSPTAVTTTASMFSGCVSLLAAPELSLVNCTNTSAMFGTCYSLISVPTYNTSNATTMNGMFSGCYSLNSLPPIDTTKATTVSNFTSSVSVDTIPAYNLANCTSIGTFIGGGGNNLSRVNATGMKVSYSVTGQKMSKAALETMFTNSQGNATAQTVTITNNWGADTALSIASGTWSSNGTSISFAGTPTGVTVGMVAYGTSISGVWKSCTFSGNTMSISGVALKGQTKISFNSTANGLTAYTVYYVVGDPSTQWASIQLSLTPGGNPITFTGSTTMNCQWEKIVTDVTGTTVTLNNPLPAAGTSSSVTFRNLNVYIMLLKNWAITG